MRNLNFKTEIEYDYVKLFFDKLNIKTIINDKYIDERFITYNSILDSLIHDNNSSNINTIKLKIVSSMDINLIFLSLIKDNPQTLGQFKEVIEFYFDTDLINGYR